MSLFHYTSKASMEEIRRSGVINPSRETGGPHGPDAVMGSGVYVTDIPPQTPTAEIIKNNYGAAANQIEKPNPDVAQAYIEIPRQDVTVECLPDSDRKVCMVPTNTGLNVGDLPCKYGVRY